MLSVSAVITAAGKNSRMRQDQEKRNIPLQNKLTLPFKSKTVIETTIDNVLNTKGIEECAIVLGHYSSEILPLIKDIDDERIKIVMNNPIDVGLSVSLLNGLNNINSDIALCVTADQPTVSSTTFNNILDAILNSSNPNKTISVLRRLEIGKLDTAKGLGMPFAASRCELIDYIKDKDDNLNPILREIFADGFEFYGVEENHPDELININYYSDYERLL